MAHSVADKIREQIEALLRDTSQEEPLSDKFTTDEIMSLRFSRVRGQMDIAEQISEILEILKKIDPDYVSKDITKLKSITELLDKRLVEVLRG